MHTIPPLSVRASRVLGHHVTTQTDDKGASWHPQAPISRNLEQEDNKRTVPSRAREPSLGDMTISQQRVQQLAMSLGFAKTSRRKQRGGRGWMREEAARQ